MLLETTQFYFMFYVIFFHKIGKIICSAQEEQEYGRYLELRGKSLK